MRTDTVITLGNTHHQPHLIHVLCLPVAASELGPVAFRHCNRTSSYLEQDTQFTHGWGCHWTGHQRTKFSLLKPSFDCLSLVWNIKHVKSDAIFIINSLIDTHYVITQSHRHSGYCLQLKCKIRIKYIISYIQRAKRRKQQK